VSYIFLLAIGIGIAAGLRSCMAPAVVAWAAHLGWLNLSGSQLAFMGSTAAVIIFSTFAIAELIVDKLSMTPKRTALVPFVARIVTGGLCGASLYAAGGQSLGIGIVLGGIGGVIGTFAGYETRRRLVGSLRIKDVFIALCEDLVALALACFLVSR